LSNGQQQPPSDLKARGRGRRLWRAVTLALQLDEHEGLLLHEASRVLDRLDALDTAIRKAGPLLPDGRPHPALAEARMQQQAFARLVASLRLPLDLSEPDRRPQRRGARGSYYPRIVREENVV
jgi:hypothetical protein